MYISSRPAEISPLEILALIPDRSVLVHIVLANCSLDSIWHEGWEGWLLHIVRFHGIPRVESTLVCACMNSRTPMT